MFQIIMLIVGLILAVVGEVWGVKRKRGLTYTAMVQWLETRKHGVGLVAKALVLAFCVSLPFHFLLGWSLLP